MSPVEIDYLGEGRTDEIVARKLIVSVNGVPGLSYLKPRTGTGKHSLDIRLNGLNRGAATGRRVLVLRDLDQDAACAPALVQILLADRHPHLLLRILVPEAESWFLADRNSYANYCGLSVGKIPTDPETIHNPKQFILGCAEGGLAPKLKRFLHAGNKRGVPILATLAEWNAEFCENHWNPLRVETSGRSQSLNRALIRLRELVASA